MRSLPGLVTPNKNAVIAYLLPYLIDPPAAKRKLNEPRLTAQEKQEAFFINVDTFDEIAGPLIPQKVRLAVTQSELPPILMFVGPIANLEEIYVCVNGSGDNVTLHQFDCILDAIDLCFQSLFLGV